MALSESLLQESFIEFENCATEFSKYNENENKTSPEIVNFSDLVSDPLTLLNIDPGSLSRGSSTIYTQYVHLSHTGVNSLNKFYEHNVCSQQCNSNPPLIVLLAKIWPRRSGLRNIKQLIAYNSIQGQHLCTLSTVSLYAYSIYEENGHVSSSSGVFLVNSYTER